MTTYFQEKVYSAAIWVTLEGTVIWRYSRLAYYFCYNTYPYVLIAS